MNIKEKLHIMQLIERLESTKASITFHAYNSGDYKTAHISIHNEIDGIDILDTEGNITCKQYKTYHSAVSALESMIKQGCV
jgi:hypothetical protein